MDAALPLLNQPFILYLNKWERLLLLPKHESPQIFGERLS